MSNNQSESEVAIYRAIDCSPGMAHLKRCRLRASSINIFRGNAEELLTFVRHACDPVHAPRLWSIDNRDLLLRTHYEITRRVHNFLAASQTLVSHTRVFMRRYYLTAYVYQLYIAKITLEFTNLPLARFVQDLRNYMLHRDLPISEMFFSAREDPQENGIKKQNSGVRYKAATLLEWDGWTKPARVYLENAGEYFELVAFAEEYRDRIIEFHIWLSEQLDGFHTQDILNLQELQQQAKQRENA